MRDEKSDGVAAGKIFFLEGRPSEDALLPPWMFRHDDLIRTLASAKLIDKKKLTNTLNFLHFKKEHIYVLLKHPRYEESVLVRAYLEPCLGEELACRWDNTYSGFKLERYLFQYLVISHDQSIIVVPAQLSVIEGDSIIVQLPETSHLISERQFPRFACQDVKAELWQNGFQAKGELIDFSAHALHLRVQAAPPSSFQWFNAEVPATIRLSNSKDIFFSGNCNCIQQKQTGVFREIVLSPIHDEIKRFQSKVLRNPRLQSSPPFSAMFEHPFFKKKIQREIFDISTSGFSLYDKSDEVVLIPGMIIPEMNIIYAGILTIRCKAQVIYRKEEDSQLRLGLAILDMDLINYHNLAKVLNNVSGANASICNEIDLDQLWELFFDADFIYPQKYKQIQSFREDFQKTYRKLYEEAPEIAKHFTYQQNGRIYSHISILRAYDRTWLSHHHAARTLNGRHTGLIVLKQLFYYLNDLRRLPSAKMDYVMCYFRPENRFTERIYNRFAQEHGNPRNCSLDLFTYLSYTVNNIALQLPTGWQLRECSASDLWELEQFYRHHSGGLFWDILDLDHQKNEQPLEQIYAKLGFIRRWAAFALHCAGELKAVFISEESDVAINLSDLLNGLKVIVMDPDIPKDIIFAAAGNVANNYRVSSIPLLIYPAEYAHNKGLRYEKQYYLWILDVNIGSEYFEYLGRRFRINFA